MSQFTGAVPDPQGPAPPQVLDTLNELLHSQLWHNGLIGRLLEELEEVKAAQRRLYDLLVPRFNEYFRDDSQARMAWIVYCQLSGQPERPFPGDLPSAREDERDAI